MRGIGGSSPIVKESAGTDASVMDGVDPIFFLYAMDDVQCSTKHDHIGIVIHQTEEEESKNIPPFREAAIRGCINIHCLEIK